MAPAPEAYFASLDKCFSGDAYLLSWERVFFALSSSSESNSDELDYVRLFLSQPESIRLLSNCFTPFERPSAKFKSEFDSKTAAIHVDNSPQAAYQIDEIKSDALWLSQKAGIDEIAALRITIQEWQCRPNSRLLGRFSEEEATSLQDAASVDSFRVSLAGPQLKEVLKRAHSGSETEFSSEKARRIRIQNIYLSEKVHILKTSRKLLCAFVNGEVSADASHMLFNHTARQLTKDDGLARLGEQLFKHKLEEGEHSRFLLDAIKAVDKRLSEFQTDGGWLSESESSTDTENAWRTLILDEIIHTMQMIYLLVQSSDLMPNGEVVLAWLRLMAEYSFLEPINPPCEDAVALRMSLQVFASVVSLGLLKLPESLALVLKNGTLSQEEALSQGKPYFLSRAHITEINEVLLNSVDMGILSASPAAFAWGAVLYAMREIAQTAKQTREMEQFQSAVDSFQSNQPKTPVTRSLEQTFYEDLLDIARVPAFGDDYVGVLTVGAIERGQIFEVISNIASMIDSLSAIDDQVTNLWIRNSLMGIVQTSSYVTEYAPELVTATLSILKAPTTTLRADKGSHITQSSDPRLVFLHNDDLMSRIFHIAKSRFPYESVPFLQLCRALAAKDELNGIGPDRIMAELDAMDTFTQVVSTDFHGYETVREDENANFVRLTRPLPMVASTTAKLNDRLDAETALVVASTLQLQPTTTGQVVSESKPAVIMWYHNYSGLTFLGSWLEEWASGGRHVGSSDDETIVEIVGLLTDLMASCPVSEEEHGPKKILEMASEGLNERSDIVSVVLKILERSLEGSGPQSVPSESLELTVACMRFLNVLVTFMPSRVWPFLSRSSLLGPSGKGSRLSAIISASEVTSGNYPFLLSCIDLFEAVIEDAVSNAAIRKIITRTGAKSADAFDRSAGVPSHVISKVLSNFVRSMVDVYNSCGNWRFNQLEHRLEVEAMLAKSFQRIIHFTYGIDETDNPSTKITAVFQEPADYILSVLRPQTQLELPLNPVLRIILSGLQIPTNTLNLRRLHSFERQLVTTLELAIKLVQAGQLSEIGGSLLEDQLFKASPILVKLYSSHDRLRLPVVKLLELLITKAASDPENEPASFLGHLGPESTCLFLDVLAQFDRPLPNIALLESVWGLLSSFVGKRQQWVAIYLLTGSSPRDSMKLMSSSSKAPSMRNTPFLKSALDSLANIDHLDPRVSLALLEFVSCSQENWSWATPQLGNHSSFFSAIINYVSQLKVETQPITKQIYMVQIAAITASLCAIYLHSAKEARDNTFVKTLVPLVIWCANNAVDLSGYNASLHANLKRNFEMKYAGCQLRQLKRTGLEKRPMGTGYYYDLDLAEKFLSYDFSWHGRKDQGFAGELERANLNLSLVEAQVNLFNSWKFFAIEHASEFSPHPEIQKSMAMVVRNCLVANTRAIPEEPIFAKLQESRVDFALSMLQRLIESGAKGPEMTGLLSVVWDAMRASGTTYENALIHDHTNYYRSLLNVLFLSLQFHIAKPRSWTAASANNSSSNNDKARSDLSPDLAIVLEIIKVVVAQGFRSLTTYLHDEPGRCSPKDFAIITAILQTALKVQDAERLYEHIVFHIEDNDTARYATTLFSWADQLTVEGDPVYGELSLIFLVQLAAIPSLAEYLAVEAVLMKLGTSRLTRILAQSKAFGPFDSVPRLYAIWIEGMLPLCLNLLVSVSRAASEVSAFLNQFEGRLARASEAFASLHAGTASIHPENQISLSMATEANALSLISFILDRYRSAGPSAGIDSQTIQELKWDKAQVKEDVEDLLNRRASLRARIVATSEKEAGWMRQQPLHGATSGAENRLEEIIVEELRAALTSLSSSEEA